MAGVLVAKDAEPATLAAFDVVVDARSPGEFAIDHVPGALNLPVLSDAERAEVGTIYTKESHFKARRIGGAYVARNVAGHVETAAADWPAAQRVLVYCWRGGMRSNAMAVILSQIGWRTSVLDGGYRTYRRRVSARLYDGPPLPKVVLLDGCTGSGKTEVLKRLGERGAQTIDLEALAEHRGSLFGGFPGRGQPSQKMFESRLLAEVEGLDPARPVVIEAESSKVGQLFIPPTLWSAMAAARAIELVAPAEQRAEFLAREYADMAEDPTQLAALLRRLPGRPAREQLAAWTGMARDKALVELAQALIEAHYDPAYHRSSRKDARTQMGSVTVASLDEPGFTTAATEVARLLAKA